MHGNVGVIALDAHDVSYEIPADFGISDGRQTRRLDRRLQPGRHARMKVIALAESGERIDHFEIGRG